MSSTKARTVPIDRERPNHFAAVVGRPSTAVGVSGRANHSCRHAAGNYDGHRGIHGLQSVSAFVQRDAARYDGRRVG